ncbi:MAG: hypothetical protein M1834_003690 [Cirrosporium novae-zelandiae]|nr:MAG: hypothetical protein M1834_003690 [Cirrosporium novae-zelandiae]
MVHIPQSGYLVMLELSIDDETVLINFEEAEVNDPSPCKVDGDRVIYISRQLRVRGSVGRPVLCDFGKARIGDKEFDDDIQPYLYRAPEVILQIPWNNKADIWNLGVMVWDLAQSRHLLEAQDANNECSNARHLAEMIARLGSPPKSFLQRSKVITKIFDINGNWKGDVEIPSLSLEELEENLEGVDKTLFLQFMRTMLRWVPEERKSALELLEDPWLNSR